ncbi:serine/threonine protein kinase [Rhodococcus sp. SORGH_AS 301]|nr:serine/threonine protein kinase [Rhodococcus sp. SORGH_AS_0301]
MAGKPHVRLASRVDSSGRMAIDAVIKTTTYNTKKAIARFGDELSGMRALTRNNTAGVLSLLDWHADVDELWYVMPLAIPLADKLAEVDFEVVVKSAATLADTLDALSRPPEPTVAHRDIKPENLFWYGDGPVLADFGIAAWFDDTTTPTVTRKGESLGPRNYLAPEARFYNEKIDWYRADIYSLAHTFWSLAERRRTLGGKSVVTLPPPGRLTVSTDRVSLARFGGPDAATLDVLMEQATSLSPSDRPSAAEFRDELLTWLTMFPGPHPRPKHLFVTGFEPIRNIIAKMKLDQNLFLDVVRAETRRVFGRVEFDETVTVDFEPRGESGRNDRLRSDSLLDRFHGRSEYDEWDGSFVVAIGSSDDLSRLVVGGTFDGSGRMDWIAESQHKNNDVWELLTSSEKSNLVIGRLTTRKIIREFIGTHKVGCTSEGQISWYAERVL